MNDELPDRLRVTAEEFEPDRDRMWTRVAEGMRAPRAAAQPERARWRVPHLAFATGAVLVLIGGVVLFGQTLGIGPQADPDPAPPAADPGTQSGEPSETDERPLDPESSSSPEGPAATGSGPGEGESTSEESEAPPEAPEWLAAEGWIDPNNTEYWTQSVVAFTSDRALTGLAIELRVEEGEGLAYLDSWTTDDNLFAEPTVTSEDGYTVLRWTLKDGAVVPAGVQYSLAGQFDPGGGPRTGEADSFTIAAEGQDGETGVLEGGFA